MINKNIIKIIQFIFSLSIIIMLHEFGHFIFAKFFSISVDKLFIFFNPWGSIFKKKIGDTVYGLGWMPLGGYIKFSRQIDKKGKLNSKFTCKRLIIILGGVIINILLSIIIISLLLFYYGETCLPIKGNVRYINNKYKKIKCIDKKKY